MGRSLTKRIESDSSLVSFPRRFDGRVTVWCNRSEYSKWFEWVGVSWATIRFVSFNVGRNLGEIGAQDFMLRLRDPSSIYSCTLFALPSMGYQRYQRNVDISNLVDPSSFFFERNFAEFRIFKSFLEIFKISSNSYVYIEFFWNSRLAKKYLIPFPEERRRFN